MKVYEMKKMEIGNAVDTPEAIVVTLTEGRIIMVMKKDIKTEVSKVSIVPDGSVKKEYKPRGKYKKGSYKSRQKLEYLPIKMSDKLGKSLNSCLALRIYKRYGVRLWNNIMADILSRVNSSKESVVDLSWMDNTMKGIYESYGLKYHDKIRWALILWLHETNMITSKRDGKGGKITYIIDRKPEIPRTIST